jgi:hypothetical protein
MASGRRGVDLDDFGAGLWNPRNNRIDRGEGFPRGYPCAEGHIV